MPAFRFTPADGLSRYYADRATWFDQDAIADWPEPPDAHWVPADSPPPIPAEPASARKKIGGDGK